MNTEKDMNSWPSAAAGFVVVCAGFIVVCGVIALLISVVGVGLDPNLSFGAVEPRLPHLDPPPTFLQVFLHIWFMVVVAGSILLGIGKAMEGPCGPGPMTKDITVSINGETYSGKVTKID